MHQRHESVFTQGRNTANERRDVVRKQWVDAVSDFLSYLYEGRDSVEKNVATVAREEFKQWVQDSFPSHFYPASVRNHVGSFLGQIRDDDFTTPARAEATFWKCVGPAIDFEADRSRVVAYLLERKRREPASFLGFFEFEVVSELSENEDVLELLEILKTQGKTGVFLSLHIPEGAENLDASPTQSMRKIAGFLKEHPEVSGVVGSSWVAAHLPEAMLTNAGFDVIGDTKGEPWGGELEVVKRGIRRKGRVVFAPRERIIEKWGA